VNDPRRLGPSPDRAGDGASDDDYAKAYSEGYGEGLREAFREMLQDASRGHTAAELRLLIESRLAHVRDDVELKRRSVLTPPKRPSWGTILRPAAPVAPWSAPPAATAVVIGPGQAFLFSEPRGARAMECVDASAAGFARVLAIGLRPPTLRRASGDRVTFVPVASSGAPGTVLGPTALSGRIREAAEEAGGALVYFDAFETLLPESGPDQMMRFISWLVSEAAASRSAVVVSVDPATLEPRVFSMLQRAFERVL